MQGILEEDLNHNTLEEGLFLHFQLEVPKRILRDNPIALRDVKVATAPHSFAVPNKHTLWRHLTAALSSPTPLAGMSQDYFIISHDASLHNADPDLVPEPQETYNFSTKALNEETMTDFLVLSLSQNDSSSGLNIVDQVCPHVSTY